VIPHIHKNLLGKPGKAGEEFSGTTQEM